MLRKTFFRTREFLQGLTRTRDYELQQVGARYHILEEVRDETGAVLPFPKGTGQALVLLNGRIGDLVDVSVFFVADALDMALA